MKKKKVFFNPLDAIFDLSQNNFIPLGMYLDFKTNTMV